MLYKLNCIIIKSCNTLKMAYHLLWNCNQWITKGKGEPTVYCALMRHPSSMFKFTPDLPSPLQKKRLKGGKWELLSYYQWLHATGIILSSHLCNPKGSMMLTENAPILSGDNFSLVWYGAFICRKRKSLN